MGYYEAVIVGGGPAGLMAAKKAAENGAQVLLLEKESHSAVRYALEVYRNVVKASSFLIKGL